MSAEPVPAVLETSFQIESVVPIENPNGGPDPWFRYVISQGPHSDNAITGTRSGTLLEVNQQLRDMVDRLNERCGKLAKKKK